MWPNPAALAARRPPHLEETNALEILTRKESNARTYARTFDRLMHRAKGSMLWDTAGNAYLDFFACAGALPLGHNHPAVIDRVRGALADDIVQQSLDIPTVPKSVFVEQIGKILPKAFAEQAKLQFCGPTGADAVEAAIKLFRTVTGRSSVFAFSGGYHGMTAGALSVTGDLGPKEPVGPMGQTAHFFPFPASDGTALGAVGEAGIDVSLAWFDQALSDPLSGMTRPAMVIVEPIQGEGGCNVAPVRWLRGIREITARYEVPLVVDEVQTGFARTGRYFAHERAGIVPDAIVMSKAVGGGYPLAVLAYRSEYDRWSPGAHSGTFRGNQIAMIAGATAIEVIMSDRLDRAALVRGGELRNGLLELREKHDCFGEVRGEGLMLGLEVLRPGEGTASRPLFDGDRARRVKRACFERGLMIESGGRHGAVLRFLPALTVSSGEVARAIEILHGAVVAAGSDKRRSPRPAGSAQPAVLADGAYRPRKNPDEGSGPVVTNSYDLSRREV